MKAIQNLKSLQIVMSLRNHQKIDTENPNAEEGAIINQVLSGVHWR